MSIEIFTYPNPYQLSTMPYWGRIKDLVQFCASQTMANGFSAEYSYFKKGQLMPVNTLVNEMYQKWNAIGKKMKQYSKVDEVLKTVNLTSTNLDIVQNSLAINTNEYLNAVRLLIEMGVKVKDISEDDRMLTLDQRYLIEAYKKLLSDNEFSLQDTFTENEIDAKIECCLENKKDHDFDYKDKSAIVFHGIHQFSPIILRVIDQISHYKKVILLFNFDPEYPRTYDTWMRVYAPFETKIKILNNSQSLPKYHIFNDSRSLGKQLADMQEGRVSASGKQPVSNLQLIRFDNTTEFSRYISDCYEKAIYNKAEITTHTNKSGNVLAYMDEQFYAAYSNVNDLLKTYYPEQFGEQRFLNYPIGRFFVSVANMWDADLGGECIRDYNDISECLLAGIVQEESSGELNETFLQCQNYLENTGVSTISEICAKMNNLKNIVGGYKLKNNPEYRKIGYFNVKPEKIGRLIEGLKELGKIEEEFFRDFQDNCMTFRRFYEKVSNFLKRRVETEENLDSEFKDILRRMLERIDSMDFPDSNSSFSCLKQTMTYYLDQDENQINSADWIVRNFEQIDGDIMRSRIQKASGRSVVYHFCCLSDANMGVNRFELFPWPLDEHFFDVACEMTDWKYQVYIESRKERKNFKKYALIYGLLNNCADVKISYIKNQDDNVNDPYFLLKLLGISDKEYIPVSERSNVARVRVMGKDLTVRKQFDENDRIRYVICHYKFALDSLIARTSVYEDQFMIKKYLAVVLADRTAVALNNVLDSSEVTEQMLEEQLKKIINDFKNISDAEWIDIRSSASRILKYYDIHGEAKYRKEFIDSMLKGKGWQKIMIKAKNSDIAQDISNTMLNANIGFNRYSSPIFCDTCTDREICPKNIK